MTNKAILTGLLVLSAQANASELAEKSLLFETGLGRLQSLPEKTTYISGSFSQTQAVNETSSARLSADDDRFGLAVQSKLWQQNNHGFGINLNTQNHSDLRVIDNSVELAKSSLSPWYAYRLGTVVLGIQADVNYISVETESFNEQSSSESTTFVTPELTLLSPIGKNLTGTFVYRGKEKRGAASYRYQAPETMTLEAAYDWTDHVASVFSVDYYRFNDLNDQAEDSHRLAFGGVYRPVSQTVLAGKLYYSNSAVDQSKESVSFEFGPQLGLGLEAQYQLNPKMDLTSQVTYASGAESFGQNFTSKRIVNVSVGSTITL
ncbi:MAG: hypothetical protein HRU19_15560 [Pseudobacteriovorax sp.]|nr:hypothetical protein [Pseudobacteriovorax sp.]